jgi:hypothetical protein
MAVSIAASAEGLSRINLEPDHDEWKSWERTRLGKQTKEKQRGILRSDGSPLRRQNVAGTSQWAQRCRRRVAFK